MTPAGRTGNSASRRHPRFPDSLPESTPASRGNDGSCSPGSPRPGPVQGLITTIYLSRAEYDQLATALPGRRLAKTRYSIAPLGIDVFGPPLHGLVTGEAEFGTDAEMLAFEPPAYVRAEVTGDPRFTGGRLAGTRREDLISWLAQYGISPDDQDACQRG